MICTRKQFFLTEILTLFPQFPILPSVSSIWLGLKSITLKCVFWGIYFFSIYYAVKQIYLLNRTPQACCIPTETLFIHFRLSSTITATVHLNKPTIFYLTFTFSLSLSLVGLWRWRLTVHHQGDHNPHGELHLSCWRLWETFSDPRSSSQR